MPSTATPSGAVRPVNDSTSWVAEPAGSFNTRRELDHARHDAEAAARAELRRRFPEFVDRSG